MKISIQKTVLKLKNCIKHYLKVIQWTGNVIGDNKPREITQNLFLASGFEMKEKLQLKLEI